ncbi:hypothetical protein EDB85DRAFT_1552580 [Lactarius pseudohatsudake]|nr:hypothetical protein EDB85DRAFT_1552580 [Lactarius pseudohatsudake]
MVLEALFYLVFALLERSKVSHRSEYAIHAAKYLRHLRDQPHHAFGVPRHAVTAFLVEALFYQVELEAENVIGEMVVLCRKLLTLVLSKIHPLAPDQPLDQVTECLRAARSTKHICARLVSPSPLVLASAILGLLGTMISRGLCPSLMDCCF